MSAQDNPAEQAAAARREHLSLILGDLSDLPEEVLQQLSGVRADDLETQILEVMRSCYGAFTLDQILIDLYRKYGTVQKRRFLQNKIYRMCKKGLVCPVPGKFAYRIVDSPHGKAQHP
jgi:hypothetical protein